MGNVKTQLQEEDKFYEYPIEDEDHKFHRFQGYSPSLKSKYMTDHETLSSSCLFSIIKGGAMSVLKVKIDCWLLFKKANALQRGMVLVQ